MIRGGYVFDYNTGVYVLTIVAPRHCYKESNTCILVKENIISQKYICNFEAQNHNNRLFIIQ